MCDAPIFGLVFPHVTNQIHINNWRTKCILQLFTDNAFLVFAWQYLQPCIWCAYPHGVSTSTWNCHNACYVLILAVWGNQSILRPLCDKIMLVIMWQWYGATSTEIYLNVDIVTMPCMDFVGKSIISISASWFCIHSDFINEENRLYTHFTHNEWAYWLVANIGLYSNVKNREVIKILNMEAQKLHFQSWT